MKLTDHFSLEEFTKSATADKYKIVNDVYSPDLFKNLQLLCMSLLEPIRSKIAVPIHISSGFRSQELNVLVGGQPNSAHLFGRAADFTSTISVEALFDIIKSMDLPFDQLIHESTSDNHSHWIHLSIPAAGKTPRRQVFNLTKSPNRTQIS